jgi:hypothetical protein
MRSHPHLCSAGGDRVIGGDTNTTAGTGTPTVGQLLCGTSNGCIAVYHHKTDDQDDDADDGH